MAGELLISANLYFKKSGATVSRAIRKAVTVTGDAYTHDVQTIAETETVVAQGADTGTPGYILIINLAAANYVKVGSTTGVYDIRINAGEFALYRHNSATIYAIAVGGTALIEYCLIEA
jgi:hypothetical protein